MQKNLKRLLLSMVIAGAGALSASAQAWQMPAVPDTLLTPQARADFLAENYWTTLDTAAPGFDPASPEIEQAFVDFLSIFPVASEQSRNRAVENLLAVAQADPAFFSAVRGMAEKYLFEPESPLFCEEFFIPFLENFVKSPLLTEGEKARAQAQLEMAMKNRPGSCLPDFGLTLRDGTETSLHAVPTADEALLIFYNPGCENCEELIGDLQRNPRIQSRLSEGSMTILAVYSGDDRKLWEATAASLPEAWIVGYEPDTLETEDLFDFRAFPTIYVIDKDKTVKIKDLSPAAFAPGF